MDFFYFVDVLFYQIQNCVSLNHLQNVLLIFFFVVDESGGIALIINFIIVILVNCMKIWNDILILNLVLIIPGQVLFNLI